MINSFKYEREEKQEHLDKALAAYVYTERFKKGNSLFLKFYFANLKPNQAIAFPGKLFLAGLEESLEINID